MAGFYETPDSRVQRYGNDFRDCWEATTVAEVYISKVSKDKVAIFNKMVKTIKFEKQGKRPQYRKKVYVTFSTGPQGIDVCPYCGFENETEDGKTYRMGWDCYRCGGN